jgi:hypothetical protein
MISGEELERRLRSISDMRNFIIAARRSLLEQYRQGKIPYKPNIDIRSDYEYWAKLAEEKGAKP